MAKKVSDEQCLKNYETMCALFKNAIPDGGRFSVVYGCGVDVGMMDFGVLRSTTYTYASYAIGYDKNVNEIAILPIDRDLETYGSPHYLKKAEIDKAKIGMMTKEIRIQSKSLPKKYITFSVQEMINQDPDEVSVCVKQDAQAKDFHTFFKEQYSK